MFVVIIGVSVGVMIVVMLFTWECVVKTLRAPEGHDHHPRHIDSGQNSRESRDDPKYLLAGKRESARKVIVRRERLIQDLVLRKEACEDRDAADRKPAGRHRDEGDRHILA